MIYFKEGPEAKNLTELLKLGFTKWTLFSPTFKDKELTVFDCKQARRSFGDLLEISRTYFPETTEKELATILTQNYNCFYCKDIKLLVFLQEGHGDNFEARMSSIYDKDYVDSRGMCYNDILKMTE